MPRSFRYFLRILPTVCRMECDCCRKCCQAICSFLFACCRCRCHFEGNTENGHLLANSTSAIAAYQLDLCQGILDSFSYMYLGSVRQNLHWDASNIVSGKTVVICAKLSRLQDDIQATLERLDIIGKPKIMLVVIHLCEQGVTPENLLTDLRDDRVTSFTNVVYSDSMNGCYECPTNGKAAADIKTFIK